MDCYDDHAVIVDPTLWCYNGSPPSIWIGTMRSGLHEPFGLGHIFSWGRPESARGPVIELEPKKPLSDVAQVFLKFLGPLDMRGWAVLAHAPVQGWPSGEIFEAMIDSGLWEHIPIDIVGMTTLRNPGQLYLRDI